MSEQVNCNKGTNKGADLFAANFKGVVGIDRSYK
jgi:hypothetical protein